MGKKRLEKDKKITKHKKKKRSRSRSSSTSSSLSSLDEETKRKLKKKVKKLRKKEKIKKKEKKALKKLLKSKVKDEIVPAPVALSCGSSCDIDINLIEKSKSLAPMTKEEWEKQQNTFKRVYDEETGRMRLVKGTEKVNGEAKMMEADIVEEFYGVYLLRSLNPDYKGKTYIGYTVDPNRRIKQHNKGKLYGGARKTSQKGPWEMALIVHGFPSDVAALRFEWAWQHPKRSRRLKSLVATKKTSETTFEYCLKVMFIMLRTPPWRRLPLTVRWLSADVMVDPPANLCPPIHMPIIFGPVVSKKLTSPKKKIKNNVIDLIEEEDLIAQEIHLCKLCHDFINNTNELLVCLNNECKVQWHIMCLARHFLAKESIGSSENILPVEGSCSDCGSDMLWGDLIRKKKGCYKNLI